MRLRSGNKNRLRTRATRNRAIFLEHIRRMEDANPFHTFDVEWSKGGAPVVTPRWVDPGPARIVILGEEEEPCHYN